MPDNDTTNEASTDSRQKILVVDDEASIRRILETRLSMIGFEIFTAADGEEAIASFNKNNPDLIILDIMMPKVDGYGVCREVRRTSDVPIIILTALGDVSERITGLELGADDYVVKPFSPKELEARVKAVLRRANTKGENQNLGKKIVKMDLDFHPSKWGSSYILPIFFASCFTHVLYIMRESASYRKSSS